jgi:hypothetical protein
MNEAEYLYNRGVLRNVNEKLRDFETGVLDLKLPHGVFEATSQ